MGGESSAVKSERLTVRTGGLTALDWATIAGLALCLPVLIVLDVYLAPPDLSLGVFPRVVIVLVAVVILGLAISEISSVRRVEFFSEGVCFFYPFHRELRRWSDLQPTAFLPVNGIWYVRAVPKYGTTRSRTYRLTIAQARAMLRYPRCPPWRLADGISGRLGI
jgi:hypothetical protein